MKRRISAFGFVLLLAVSGCSMLSAGDKDLTGKIEKIQVDCGGWGLQTDDELYELVNLPNKYQEDGLRVRAEAKRRNDLNSCTMVGPIVEVLHVERLD
jgi:hypothetical protein